MQDSKKHRITSMTGTILVAAFVLSLWEMLAGRGVIDYFFFSKPSAILLDLKTLFVTGQIWPHIIITLQETFWGLVIGSAAGIIVAFIFGQFNLIAGIFDPIVMALYGIPKLALGPLFILWFGLGIKAKIFISTFAVFFLVFFSAYAGFRSVEPSLISTVKLMGATKGQIMRKVVFPSCMPWIMAGLRAGIGASLLGAIVGEYIGSNRGLGWMVLTAGGMYDTTRVFSSILILTMIIAIMNGGLKLLEKRVLKWRPSVQ
ncbi:ABC transporter permease [Pelotomaculum isophthalicicum JI]|uniref:ABC transporter permease n=1 Tax=Pelotomaculum isophthalicicum JI TaxID=947010 RepID=A0A9X4JVN2_9FIRM|nr:ABC transporter permease [Pelotomaculum isophthalicicum]MDF9407692.1 ABC transporter permease [Pelotomaculum isophthalicicum JI]